MLWRQIFTGDCIVADCIKSLKLKHIVSELTPTPLVNEITLLGTKLRVLKITVIDQEIKIKQYTCIQKVNDKEDA